MRRTANALAVAQALLADPDAQHYGYPLSKTSGVRSGRLYPMLSRMLDNGWLVDGWEDAAETRQRQRPARRYYQLTETGRGALRDFVEGCGGKPTGKTPASIRLARLYSVGPPDECWPWSGQSDADTYGQFRLDDGTLTGAHRAVYESRVGPIPPGLTLDHLCRNPPCVNPAHLEPVTQAVNNERKPVIVAARCRNNHELTPDNVVLRQGGRKRTCRECERARRRRWRGSPSGQEIDGYVSTVVDD